MATTAWGPTKDIGAAVTHSLSLPAAGLALLQRTGTLGQAIAERRFQPAAALADNTPNHSEALLRPAAGLPRRRQPFRPDAAEPGPP